MPNTGERREIKRYVNAKESETVQETQKLVSKTKQRTAQAAIAKQKRELRNDHTSPAGGSPKTAKAPTDKEASDRMADEGGPNLRP